MEEWYRDAKLCSKAGRALERLARRTPEPLLKLPGKVVASPGKTGRS